jgi:uncharacterized protein with PIN domain
MLGKIAKKLRIFGFDTEYLADIDDNEIINRYRDGKRIIITKDRRLHNRSVKLNIPCLPISLENELETFITIMKESNINYIFPVPNESTRCSLCNRTLDKIHRESVEDLVPKKVFENIGSFFKCSKCQKIYWKGKHVKEINHLIHEINKGISQI